MLTEGYLNGWLDFEDKTRFSRIRENYILSHIEKRQILEAIRLKLNLDASLASGNLSEQTIGIAYDTYEKYVGTALPYLAKKDKIDEEKKPIDKQQLTAWKAMLAQKKKEMAHLMQASEEPNKQVLEDK